MTAHVSPDGHWRLTVIRRNGQPLLRAEHDSPEVCTYGRKLAVVRTGTRWWLAADIPVPDGISAEDVAREFFARVAPEKGTGKCHGKQ